jgi:thymidylate synthase
MSLYVKIPLVYFERDIIMSQWDKDYLGLCRKILEEGTEVVNRTGTNTIKVPSHHFHFDLSQEFPILTTKQLLSAKQCLK